MSGSTTIRMINAYIQQAAVTLFFSGMFRSPKENFYNSEEVEIDIERSEEDISIVVTNLSTGYRMNSDDIYTNKRFKAPIHKEAIPLNSFDLIKRMPGSNPFENPEFRANLIKRMFKGMVKIERKIRRAIEQQASQVLQTGTVTLIDSNGTALYTIDYKPKTTHFPTTGTIWSSGSSTKLADIDALGRVIRSDGLAPPDQLIFGVDALIAFLDDTAVIQKYDTRRLDKGTIAPFKMNGQGGEFHGFVEVGNYRYDIWSYDGRYTHPQTGVSTPFMDPGKVIVRASSGRLDATFGAIPNIGRLLGTTGPNLIPELPGRISNSAGGMDLFANAWTSPDGEQLFGGVGARPLVIPTAIDTFGCLDTLL